MEKILMIRFSSLGDVTQSLSVASRLNDLGEVHWVIRSDMADLAKAHPSVKKLWILDRKAGFFSLLQLAFQLRAERFSRIYDAHNSLRSRILCALLWIHFPFPKLVRKPRYTWKRILLFWFRINTFRKPFSGQRELLRPLAKWGLSTEVLPPTPQIFFTEKELDESKDIFNQLQGKSPIGLAPSSAHELKKWPKDYWKELIQILPEEKFIAFGGPDDHFIQEIQAAAPDRVINAAGRLTVKGSGAALLKCKLLVANDTGLLHIAEQSGVPAIALMGPAPFGFPSRESTRILERNLSCRPCSKHGQGPCKNPIFQECLRSISPQEVAQHAVRILSSDSNASS